MVKDKITLCREMLPQTAGVERDAAFSEVVGFLEVRYDFAWVRVLNCHCCFLEAPSCVQQAIPE